MKRNCLWEESPVGPKTANRLWVTMDEKGSIMLGARAVEALKDPNWVVLMFDRLNSRIGIQPSDRYARNAFPVLQRSNGRHRVIRANSFCRFYGIRFGFVRAFTEIEIEDGVMALNLGTTVPAGRRKKNER
ncbi:MAG: hypothetical protein QUS14_01335 [Pyrinomonadaceae bacterium]|nr:hypothetical protein [Pyrinomonadaceae bacterium]